MTHKTTITDNYILITSDEEITGIGFRLDVERNSVGVIDDDVYYNEKKDKFKKIIGHLPIKENIPTLQGVPLLPPLPSGEDDVEKLAEIEYPIFDGDLLGIAHNQKHSRIDFIKGYNKAKEKERNKLTPFKNLIALLENGFVKGTIDNKYGVNDLIIDEIKVCKEYLQSLSQPKMPIGFKVEMGTKYLEDSRWETHPIIVINQEGQNVMLGEWIY